MLPLIKLPGGKRYQIKEIIRYLDKSRTTYIEGFAGGLNVLLNLPTNFSNKIIIDTDFDKINLYDQVCNPEFYNKIKDIPYSQTSFEYAADYKTTDDNIDRAVKFLIRNRMSFDGMMKNYSWSDRLRGGKPENVNAWENLKKRIPSISEKLNGVTKKCTSFMDYIQYSSSTFYEYSFYLDPPYYPGTRSDGLYGDNEMTVEQHELLLKIITSYNLSGNIIISGYDNDLYNDYLLNWNKIVYTKTVNMGVGEKEQRNEILWIRK